MSSIAWIYLDKRAASINAVKDYPMMKVILEQYEDEISKTKARMTNMSKANDTGVANKPDPKAHEMFLVFSIDQIDRIEKKYAQAIEYMDWFLPAWEMLSSEDRMLLSTYQNKGEGGKGTATIGRLTETLGYERSTLYRKREKALEQITFLLYGR